MITLATQETDDQFLLLYLETYHNYHVQHMAKY